MYKDNFQNLKYHFFVKVEEYKQSLGILSLPWPGNSPDLNPIENVWAIMGRKIAKQRPKGIAELKNKILSVWRNEVTQELLTKLYDSMPRRVKAVIKAHGGTTSY